MISLLPIKSKLRRIIRVMLRRPRPWHELYSVGRCTYGNPSVINYGDKATLKVGAFCSIAIRVQILLGGNHRSDWVTTYPFPFFRPSAKRHLEYHFSKGDIVIGNDVWIGHAATILSGVTIGHGAIVGACAVVTKDVPPYGIVAGNPARLIRKRFSEEDISTLLQIEWWQWPDETIDRAMPLLLSGNIAGLRSFAEMQIPQK
jgi:chloramphenicol O-acetyltransferase type B